MDAVISASSFSQNGDYFAQLSVDGRLRIWDATSGKVDQEISVNSKVQSSCTCLCWTKLSLCRSDRKKLKRKKVRTGDDDAVLPSLSIGTEKGVVFSYNTATGETDVPTVSSNEGHNARVNCIVYQENGRLVYSCSDDKYIIQWDGANQTIKRKWKGDEQSVKMLCLGPTGTTLLSAGCSIKLWNLHTKELLQTYNGHSSPVTLLRFSQYRQQIDGLADDGYYFMSGSNDDRVISAWQVNTTKQENKEAIATFIISDVARFADVVYNEGDEKPIKLCVGCVDGKIHFFTCMLNGRASRPVESVKTVTYTAKKEDQSSKPLPFINGRLSKSNGDVLLNLVSGLGIRPSFLTLNYETLGVETTIEKDFSTNMLLKEVKRDVDESIQVAAKASNVEVISADVPKFPKKQKKVNLVPEQLMNGNVKELSLGERMEVEDKNPSSDDFVMKMKQSNNAPSAGSFAQLLIQALHSKDQKLLTEVLYNGRSNQQKIVLNTVKRIPNSLVESLINTLTKELLTNPNRSKSLIGWLKAVVSVHLTLILTNESCRDALGSLYRFVKSQEEIHMPLMALQGKIDMLYAYASDNNVEDNIEGLSKAEVVYNDDSDDETENLWRDIRTLDDADDTTGTSEDDAKITETDENAEDETGTDASMESEDDDDDIE